MAKLVSAMYKSRSRICKFYQATKRHLNHSYTVKDDEKWGGKLNRLSVFVVLLSSASHQTEVHPPPLSTLLLSRLIAVSVAYKGCHYPSLAVWLETNEQRSTLHTKQRSTTHRTLNIEMSRYPLLVVWLWMTLDINYQRAAALDLLCLWDRDVLGSWPTVPMW